MLALREKCGAQRSVWRQCAFRLTTCRSWSSALRSSLAIGGGGSYCTGKRVLEWRCFRGLVRGVQLRHRRAFCSTPFNRGLACKLFACSHEVVVRGARPWSLGHDIADALAERASTSHSARGAWRWSAHEQYSKLMPNGITLRSKSPARVVYEGLFGVAVAPGVRYKGVHAPRPAPPPAGRSPQRSLRRRRLVALARVSALAPRPGRRRNQSLQGDHRRTGRAPARPWAQVDLVAVVASDTARQGSVEVATPTCAQGREQAARQRRRRRALQAIGQAGLGCSSSRPGWRTRTALPQSSSCSSQGDQAIAKPRCARGQANVRARPARARSLRNWNRGRCHLVAEEQVPTTVPSCSAATPRAQ